MPQKPTSYPKHAPSWMRNVLLCAAVYNIFWGGWVVLFPNHYFDLIHMVRPTYPMIWQAVGMIVGVYGVGYGIAAFDPVRHWPVVLVGFMGKVFGPIGLLQAVWMGKLPWKFGYINITNDIIWIIPFALILAHSYKVERSRNRDDTHIVSSGTKEEVEQ